MVHAVDPLVKKSRVTEAVDGTNMANGIQATISAAWVSHDKVAMPPLAYCHSSKTSMAEPMGMLMKKLRMKLSMFWLLNQNTSDGCSAGNLPLYLKRLSWVLRTYSRTSNKP